MNNNYFEKNKTITFQNEERRNKMNAIEIILLLILLFVVAFLAIGGIYIFSIKKKKKDDIVPEQKHKQQEEITNKNKVSIVNIIDALSEIYEDDSSN